MFLLDQEKRQNLDRVPWRVEKGRVHQKKSKCGFPTGKAREASVNVHTTDAY